MVLNAVSFYKASTQGLILMPDQVDGDGTIKGGNMATLVAKTTAHDVAPRFYET